MAEDNKSALQCPLGIQCLLDMTPVGIAVMDSQGSFIGCNRGFASILGYVSSELIGKSWEDITPDVDVEFDREQLSRLSKLDNTDISITKRFINRFGHPLKVRLHLLQIDDEDAPYYIVLIKKLPDDLQVNKLSLEYILVWFSVNWKVVILLTGLILKLGADYSRLQMQNIQFNEENRELRVKIKMLLDEKALRNNSK